MRRTYQWNDNWTFAMPDGRTVPVTIPHTWNGTDGQDGGNDYRRCRCRYTKRFLRPDVSEGERCVLLFKGVNSEAEVALNGVRLYRHEGGYSTFIVDITEHLRDENVLEVLADNTPNDTVYPQKADFTFYGGIYRDVEMEILPPVHFVYGQDSAPALRLEPRPEGKTGRLGVQVRVDCGAVCGPEELSVKLTVTDQDGRTAAETEVPAGSWRLSGEGEHKESGDGGSIRLVDAGMAITDVRLWDGLKDPHLYTVRAQLLAGGRLLDEVSGRTGFRTFHVDPDKGFFLNGRPYPLRGVCRHQDRPVLGNAITKAEHDEDMELILEVGATTVRLSHYQHDAYFYDLCDQEGLVVWAEIPYISKHLSSGDGNAMAQMKELIHQNYNHPSIVCWCISNEITMSHAGADCVNCHREINDYCHREDPGRLTVVACYMPMRANHRVAHVTDLVSYNLYFGWYFPFTQLAAMKMDFFHKVYKNTPLGLSEYGAEAMPGLHSEHPRRGDNTEEYQCIYHEKMLKIIEDRDYLWATHIWNMFDFAADARNQGGEPGMNHKGLVTFDRKLKKDSFYLYKAHWSEEPFVHLCGKRFVNRTGGKTRVKVYSNQPEVTLYNNGRKIASVKGSRIFSFQLELEEENRLEVKAGRCTDQSVIRRAEKKDPSYKMRKGGSSKSWEK